MTAMQNQDIRAKLLILRRQYFQLVDPLQLRWPDEGILKDPSVQAWIFNNLFNVTRLSAPPPARYQLRVLKQLISKLERSIVDPEEDEISDDLMSAMSSLLSSKLPPEATSAQQKAFVTYTYSSLSMAVPDGNLGGDCSVTLLESRSVISSSGTTGLRTWEAALLLGAYLTSAQGRAIIHEKRIFELGAGTGMLSILCAKHLGAAGMVATDGDEAVVDAIKTNMFLNGLDVDNASQSSVQTAALKWGWPLNAPTFAEDYGMEPPDILIGADVTYDSSVIPALVSSLREFFELKPALQVLIAATIRNEHTFETFLNACRRARFSMKTVEFAIVPAHLQDGPFYAVETPIQIWTISRSQPAVDDAFAV